MRLGRSSFLLPGRRSPGGQRDGCLSDFAGENQVRAECISDVVETSVGVSY